MRALVVDKQGWSMFSICSEHCSSCSDVCLMVLLITSHHLRLPLRWCRGIEADTLTYILCRAAYCAGQNYGLRPA